VAGKQLEQLLALMPDVATVVNRFASPAVLWRLPARVAAKLAVGGVIIALVAACGNQERVAESSESTGADTSDAVIDEQPSTGADTSDAVVDEQPWRRHSRWRPS